MKIVGKFYLRCIEAFLLEPVGPSPVWLSLPQAP